MSLLAYVHMYVVTCVRVSFYTCTSGITWYLASGETGLLWHPWGEYGRAADDDVTVGDSGGGRELLLRLLLVVVVV